MGTLGSASIQLTLDRSQFDSDLTKLQQQDAGQIAYRIKLDTKEIDRQLKGLRIQSPIFIPLEIDTKTFDQQIKKLSTSIDPIKVDLAPNVKDFQEKLRRLSNISPIAVDIKVDETKIKQQFEQIGRYAALGFQEGFSGVEDAGKSAIDSMVKSVNNRLGIQSPSRVFREIGKYAIAGLMQGLDVDQGEIKQVVNKISDSFRKIDANIVVKADFKNLQKQIDAGLTATVAIEISNDSATKLSDSIADAVTASLHGIEKKGLFGGIFDMAIAPFKLLGKALLSTITLPMKALGAGLGHTFEGLFLGAGLPLGESLGAGIAKGVNKYLKGKFKAGLGDIGFNLTDLSKADWNLAKTIDALFIEGNPIGKAKNVVKELKEVFADLKVLVAPGTIEKVVEFGKLSSAGPREFKKQYVAAAKKAKEQGRELTPEQFTEELKPKAEFKAVGTAIKLAAAPFGFKNKVMSFEAQRQIEARSQKLIIPEITEPTVTLVTGGFQKQRGRGAYEIAELAKTVLPNSHVIPIPNTYTDRKATDTKSELLNFIKSLGMDVPPGLLDTLQNTEKLVGTGAKGYSPDAIRIAAYARAVQRKYPDKPVNAVTFSGGTYPLEQAIQFDSDAGGKAKGIGLGAGLYGLTGRYNPNYRAMIGEQDPLGFPFQLLKPTKNTTIIPNFADTTSMDVHNPKRYFANPSVQDAMSQMFQGFVPPQGTAKAQEDIFSLTNRKVATNKHINRLNRFIADPTSVPSSAVDASFGELADFLTKNKSSFGNAPNSSIPIDENPHLRTTPQLIASGDNLALDAQKFYDQAKKVLSRAATILAEPLGISETQLKGYEPEQQLKVVRAISKVKSEAPTLNRTVARLEGTPDNANYSFYTRDSAVAKKRTEDFKGLISYLRSQVLTDLPADIDKLAQEYLKYLEELQGAITKLVTNGEAIAPEILAQKNKLNLLSFGANKLDSLEENTEHIEQGVQLGIPEARLKKYQPEQRAKVIDAVYKLQLEAPNLTRTIDRLGGAPDDHQYAFYTRNSDVAQKHTEDFQGLISTLKEKTFTGLPADIDKLAQEYLKYLEELQGAITKLVTNGEAIAPEILAQKDKLNLLSSFEPIQSNAVVQSSSVPAKTSVPQKKIQPSTIQAQELKDKAQQIEAGFKEYSQTFKNQVLAAQELGDFTQVNKQIQDFIKYAASAKKELEEIRHSLISIGEIEKSDSQNAASVGKKTITTQTKKIQQELGKSGNSVDLVGAIDQELIQSPPSKSHLHTDLRSQTVPSNLQSLPTLELQPKPQNIFDIGLFKSGKNKATEKIKSGQEELKLATENFQKIFTQVVKASGLNPEDVTDRTPSLAFLHGMDKDAGQYSPRGNRIALPMGTRKRLAKGLPSLEEIKTIAHEIRHAIQMDFGSVAEADVVKGKANIPLLSTKRKSDRQNALSSTRAYRDEYKKNFGFYPNKEVLESVMALEEDAVAFAAEIAASLHKNLKKILNPRKNSKPLSVPISTRKIPLPPAPWEIDPSLDFRNTLKSKTTLFSTPLSTTPPPPPGFNQPIGKTTLPPPPPGFNQPIGKTTLPPPPPGFNQPIGKTTLPPPPPGFNQPIGKTTLPPPPPGFNQPIGKTTLPPPPPGFNQPIGKTTLPPPPPGFNQPIGKTTLPPPPPGFNQPIGKTTLPPPPPGFNQPIGKTTLPPPPPGFNQPIGKTTLPPPPPGFNQPIGRPTLTPLPPDQNANNLGSTGNTTVTGLNTLKSKALEEASEITNGVNNRLQGIGKNADPNRGIGAFLSGLKVGKSGAETGVSAIANIFNNIKNQAESSFPILKNFNGLLTNLFKGFLAFQGGMILQSVLSKLSSDAFKAFVELDRLKTALNFASGGSAGGAQNLAFVRKTVEDLKVPLQASTEGFVGLAAAARGTALEGKGTRELFLGMADASTVLSLGNEQSQRAFKALTDILNKGKVSAEEMRGQLSESGLAGAMGIAARAMGVTEQEFSRLLDTGQILSQDFLPKFAKQLQVEFGDAAKDAAGNAQSAIFGVENAFLSLQQGIGEGVSPAATAGLNALSAILEQVAKVGKEIAIIIAAVSTTILVNLGKALTTIIGELILTKAAGASLGGTFSQLATTINNSFSAKLTVGITAVLEVVNLLNDAINTDLVKSFNKAAEAAKKTAEEAANAYKKTSKPESSNGVSRLFDKYVIDFLNKDVGPIKGGFFGKKIKTFGELERDTTIKDINDLSDETKNFLAAAGVRLQGLKSGKGKTGQLPKVDAELFNAEQQRQIFQAQIKRNFIDKGKAIPAELRLKQEAQNEQIKKLNDKRADIAKPIMLDSTKTDQYINSIKSLLEALDDPKAITTLGGVDAVEKLKTKLKEIVVPAKEFKANLDAAIASMRIDPVRAFSNTLRQMNLALNEGQEKNKENLAKNKLANSTEAIAGFSTDKLASRKLTFLNANDEYNAAVADEKNYASQDKAYNKAVNRPEFQATLKRLGVSPDASIAKIDDVLKNTDDEADKGILEKLKSGRETKAKFAESKQVTVDAKAKRNQVIEDTSLYLIDEEAAASRAAMQKAENDKISFLKGAQAVRLISEEMVNEQIARIQLSSSQLQKHSIVDQLTALRIYHEQGKISAEKFTERQRALSVELTATERQEAENRLAVQQATLARRLKDIEFVNKKAESAQALSSTNATVQNKEKLLASGLTPVAQDQFALAQNQIDQKAASDRVGLIKNRIAQNKQLYKEGLKDVVEFLLEEYSLNVELATANRELIDQKITGEEKYRESVEHNIQRIMQAEENRFKKQSSQLDESKAKLDLYNQSLERTNKLEQSRQSLSKALSDAALTPLENQKTDTDDAQSLVDKLKDPNVKRRTKRAAREQLRDMGYEVNSKTKPEEIELQIKEKRIEDENRIALIKQMALEKEQEFQRKSLENDLKRQRIAAQMLLYEAQGAQLSAQKAKNEAEGALKIAISKKDPLAIETAKTNLEIADKQVDLSNERVTNAQANLNDQGEIAANSTAEQKATQGAQTESLAYGEKRRQRQSAIDLVEAGEKARQPMSLSSAEAKTQTSPALRGLAPLPQKIDINQMPKLDLKPGENLFDAYQRQRNEIKLPTQGAALPSNKVDIPPVDTTAQVLKSTTIQPRETSGGNQFVEALKMANQGIEQRLDALRSAIITLANTPRSLTVSTANPIDDAADFMNRMSRGQVIAAGM